MSGQIKSGFADTLTKVSPAAQDRTNEAVAAPPANAHRYWKPRQAKTKAAGVVPAPAAHATQVPGLMARAVGPSRNARLSQRCEHGGAGLPLPLSQLRWRFFLFCWGIPPGGRASSIPAASRRRTP